ncbi:MAG: glycosyltransferase [Cyclobacteriaceae bacterium]
MRQKLVILTTNFGTNFSGGALATCEVFSRIQNQFTQITVLGSAIGDHTFTNLKFIKVTSWFQTYLTIKKLEDKATIFYGDFYNAFLLGLAKVPFVFTYHDNWPELSKLNIASRIQGLFFTNIYAFVFRKATVLITVSDFKKKLLEKYSSNVLLVPNGFNRIKATAAKNTIEKSQILMVGNIDERKYKLALKLFGAISHLEDIGIDIYGHVVDEKLVMKLEKFPFVNLKGFHKKIPFSSYKLLLHTSFTESFGLIFCEAIFNEIPVLAFDAGGASTIITPDNGRLVPAYDIGEMQKMLESLMSDPISVDSNTVKTFSWETTSLRYQKIFQDVD